MKKSIKQITKSLMIKCGTNDPSVIADHLGITIISMDLDDVAGFYMLLQRRRYIFINSEINDDAFRHVVLAHELGHAILHRKENCCFMEHHTLLLTSKIERQANLFAAELLITDDMLRDFSGYTKDQFCNCSGYPIDLLNLKYGQK